MRTGSDISTPKIHNFNAHIMYKIIKEIYISLIDQYRTSEEYPEYLKSFTGMIGMKIDNPDLTNIKNDIAIQLKSSILSILNDSNENNDIDYIKKNIMEQLNDASTKNATNSADQNASSGGLAMLIATMKNSLDSIVNTIKKYEIDSNSNIQISIVEVIYPILKYIINTKINSAADANFSGITEYTKKMIDSVPMVSNILYLGFSYSGAPTTKYKIGNKPGHNYQLTDKQVEKSSNFIAEILYLVGKEEGITLALQIKTLLDAFSKNIAELRKQYGLTKKDSLLMECIKSAEDNYNTHFGLMTSDRRNSSQKEDNTNKANTIKIILAENNNPSDFERILNTWRQEREKIHELKYLIRTCSKKNIWYVAIPPYSSQDYSTELVELLNSHDEFKNTIIQLNSYVQTGEHSTLNTYKSLELLEAIKNHKNVLGKSSTTNNNLTNSTKNKDQNLKIYIAPTPEIESTILENWRNNISSYPNLKLLILINKEENIWKIAIPGDSEKDYPDIIEVINQHGDNFNKTLLLAKSYVDTEIYENISSGLIKPILENINNNFHLLGKSNSHNIVINTPITNLYESKSTEEPQLGIYPNLDKIKIHKEQEESLINSYTGWNDWW